MSPTTRPVGDRPVVVAASPPPAPHRIVIAVLSSGQPARLSETICALTGQSRPPDEVILSVTGEGDLDRTALVGLPFPVRLQHGTRNVLARRNQVLKGLSENDIVQFQADDLLLKPGHLATVERLFAEDPRIILANGTAVAEFPNEEIEPHLGNGPFEIGVCQPDLIALRARPLLRHDIRFDEALLPDGPYALPDFCQQLAVFGTLIHSEELSALRGHDAGQSSSTGAVLGYAQIAEPVHLSATGRMPRAEARGHIGRSLARSLFRMPRFGRTPQERGFLHGNLRAIGDLLTGRLDPGRAEPQ